MEHGDVEMDNCQDHIAKRLEFHLSDEEDLNEEAGEGPPRQQLLDSSGSDEGLCMSIRRSSPRKPLRHLRASTNKDVSPPYSQVRALRLFDSPATPKTLLDHCRQATNQSMLATPAPVRSRSRIAATVASSKLSVEKRSTSLRPQDRLPQPAANVNPFTPTGMLLTSKKRTRSKRSLNGSIGESFQGVEAEAALNFDTDGSDAEELPPKRIALHQTSVPRYNKEFHEICLLGQGQFGSVHKCTNRLDGCVYAVKKSLMPVAGSNNERSALNEVWAHAVLGQHPHVVRYYSAWAENGHMIIQNEFCNAGTLEEWMASKGPAHEPQLKTMLLQIAEGLHYIHSKQLAHLDIKPGNIFICRGDASDVDGHHVHHDSDDGFDELEHDDCHGLSTSSSSSVSPTSSTSSLTSLSAPLPPPPTLTYKIGDLGHVTSTVHPVRVEEGDCRYLPLEILHENYDQLAKGDVFSLGLTIYEMAGGGPLQQNGVQWQAIRSEGRLPFLAGRYSAEFHALLEQMIHPDAAQRPTAHALTQHPLLAGAHAAKSKDQLSRELTAERLKNRQLSEKLQEATRHLQHLLPLTSLSASPALPCASALAQLVIVGNGSSNNNNDDDDDDENTIVMESIAVGGQNVVGLVGSTATASSIKPSKRLLLGRKMSRSLSNTDF